ncbi:MAG: rod shape-determining protein MreC [Chloroflexi bacterium]|nr:rod shape-determining protein MreC [Chloroflexota bacterium]MCY3582079.1 rod shape-determining protein MreC [Chloroflexota bacterium]MCY3715304.1 rod shape-determining protein MreC [Chloroflexota bacterium]MDE2649513.1 rod shape-determining protein MreC [Chloroflexota bacterium]MXV92279.1 rod shape-determining protein MreC [Chloroflexota bacterium]
MRSLARPGRFLSLLLMLMLCGILMTVSIAGLLAPVEDVAAAPLTGLAGLLNRLSLTANNTLEALNDWASAQDRIAELEEQLARRQVELIRLREAASDYERLVSLLGYISALEEQEFITADVIAVEQTGIARHIIINRGARDGIAVGMPVSTDLGLVGRIIDISANAAQVQLITDENSSVSSRLQTTRAHGSIVGQASGALRLTMVDLDEAIRQGDLVITSGLGGNFPADIVVGQVTSVRQFEFELFQEAEVRSLIDFAALEFVLVLTSFEPVNFSVFAEGGDG